MMPVEIRNDWTLEEIRELAEQGLLELVYRAATVHRQFHEPGEVQICKLISVKTGACPEDCAYCSQSSRYETEVRPTATDGAGGSGEDRRGKRRRRGRAGCAWGRLGAR